MSKQPTPSPRLGPSPPDDESSLPGGQCRYILLMPEIKGQRCACVNFTRKKSMPSAVCECGHLACYHMKTIGSPVERNEMEILRQRVQILEDHLIREQESALGGIIGRLSQLEELLEKSREEASQEIKGTYRNLNRAWHSISELERRGQSWEERLGGAERHLSVVNDEVHKLGQRQMELVDADIALEERLENLVDTLEEPQDAPKAQRQTGQQPSSGVTIQAGLATTAPSGEPSSGGRLGEVSIDDRTSTVPSGSRSMTPRLVPGPADTSTWTVHVSLLPTATQAFPFEKDTTAYKRCLSRGLHQMVVVNGLDSSSFVHAVSKAFSRLLKGRRWMPLRAKLCDAEQLWGLPMLRKLDAPLLRSDYFDAEFLREHCAVGNASGKMDSLYIAMESDTYSWHFLRRCAVHVEGLEESWAFDPLLDQGDDAFDDKYDHDVDDVGRPSAGDIIPAVQGLKRAASEMSRSSSFGSTTSAPGDIEEFRAKIPRTCPLPNGVVDTRRGIETA